MSDKTDPFGRPLTSGDPLFGEPEPETAEQPATGSQWLPPQPGPDAPPSSPPPPAWIPPAETAPSRHQPSPHQQYAPAPVGATANYMQRVGAAVVDFFVRAGIVLAFVLLGAILYAGGDDSGSVGVTVGAVIGAICGLAYAPVMMARTGGQTLGHRATGTRIVHATGRTLTGGQAAVREVLVKGVLFDGIGGFFVIPTLLNYAWPLWDANNEALHDKMCTTRVVTA